MVSEVSLSQSLSHSLRNNSLSAKARAPAVTGLTSQLAPGISPPRKSLQVTCHTHLHACGLSSSSAEPFHSPWLSVFLIIALLGCYVYSEVLYSFGFRIAFVQKRVFVVPTQLKTLNVIKFYLAH